MEANPMPTECAVKTKLLTSLSVPSDRSSPFARREALLPEVAGTLWSRPAHERPLRLTNTADSRGRRLHPVSSKCGVRFPACVIAFV